MREESPDTVTSDSTDDALASTGDRRPFGAPRNRYTYTTDLSTVGPNALKSPKSDNDRDLSGVNPASGSGAGPRSDEGAITGPSTNQIPSSERRGTVAPSTQETPGTVLGHDTSTGTRDRLEMKLEWEKEETRLKADMARGRGIVLGKRLTKIVLSNMTKEQMSEEFEEAELQRDLDAQTHNTEIEEHMRQKKKLYRAEIGWVSSPESSPEPGSSPPSQQLSQPSSSSSRHQLPMPRSSPPQQDILPPRRPNTPPATSSTTVTGATPKIPSSSPSKDKPLPTPTPLPRPPWATNPSLPSLGQQPEIPSSPFIDNPPPTPTPAPAPASAQPGKLIIWSMKREAAEGARQQAAKAAEAAAEQPSSSPPTSPTNPRYQEPTKEEFMESYDKLISSRMPAHQRKQHEEKQAALDRAKAEKEQQEHEEAEARERAEIEQRKQEADAAVLRVKQEILNSLRAEDEARARKQRALQDEMRRKAKEERRERKEAQRQEQAQQTPSRTPQLRGALEQRKAERARKQAEKERSERLEAAKEAAEKLKRELEEARSRSGSADGDVHNLQTSTDQNYLLEARLNIMQKLGRKMSTAPLEERDKILRKLEMVNPENSGIPPTPQRSQSPLPLPPRFSPLSTITTAQVPGQFAPSHTMGHSPTGSESSVVQLGGSQNFPGAQTENENADLDRALGLDDGSGMDIDNPGMDSNISAMDIDQDYDDNDGDVEMGGM